MAGATVVSHSYHIQIASVAQPLSCPVGARGSSHWGKGDGASTLTTHLHQVPRSGNSVAVSILPDTSLWHGA
jgi:hypothetical protein